ncbi:hypothetical protein [Novipirellula sp.]|uniref:hypothetical protein n=1 Tax=Novipirellula sp. TaxID=2795430 RepID=UPI003567FB2B
MGSPINASWLIVVALSAVACVADWTSLTADDGSLASDPYVVFVAQDEAYARCGPSDEFYRTDALRYGQELEVYVETADGWLGVRPPDDSFCWIPADAVEIAGDGDTAVVTEDRTVAWIGTHLGRARQFRWQVQLAVGEPVTVIGKGEREGADGPRLWYRIVPPSGEFRWVHQSQIAESAEQLVQAIRKERNTNIEFLPGGRTAPQATVANNDNSPQYADGDEEDSFAGRGTLSSESSSRRRSPSDSVAMQNTSSVLLRDAEAVQTSDPHASDSHASQPVALSPVAGDSVPQLREAPLARDTHLPSEAIGSGVSEQWRTNPAERASREAANTETVSEAMSKRGLLASVEFIGRPRLSDIDAGIRQIGGGLLERTSAGGDAPNAAASSVEANWVAGSTRDRAESIRQVADIQPTTSTAGTQNPRMASPIPASPAPATRYVSAAAIAAIETEVRTADTERLSLIFSRLMAASASAAEMAPVVKAAHQISISDPDPVVAGRARLLAERIQKYQNVAQRRDGNAVIQTSHAPSLPTAPASLAVASTSTAQPQTAMQAQTGPLLPAMSPSIQSPPGIAAPENASAGTDELTATGFLVQVYSARKDSPPFAITDSTGRTLAYATPTPGLNLRMHLNSEVRVQGTRSYLQGLNTPHIRVAQAIRTAEY